MERQGKLGMCKCMSGHAIKSVTEPLALGATPLPGLALGGYLSGSSDEPRLGGPGWRGLPVGEADSAARRSIWSR